MSSLLSLLSIARDGMTAQQGGAAATGENVTNVNTLGYARRAVLIQSRPNGGAELASTNRVFDRFTYGRVVAEEGKRGAADARSGALADVQELIAPSGGGGIGDHLNQFFDALNNLVGFPGDLTARQKVLNEAQDLASSISGAASGLATKSEDLLRQAQGVATDVNERLDRIAMLNQQISAAHGLGDEASTLRDQRDSLVRDVGQRIGARSIEGKDGSVTLFAGDVTVVEGGTAASITVDLDASSAMRVLVTRASGPPLDVTTRLGEGSLAGLREARDVDLASTRQSLDTFATDLATRVDAVHASGFGLDGASGRRLFAAPTATDAAYSFAVDPSMIGQPSRVAAAASASDVPGGNDVAVRLRDLGSAASIGALAGSPAARFAAIAGDVGTRQVSAQDELTLRDGTVAQAQKLQDSTSGVSIDEEMVNLTRYQRAFDASVRVMKTADELLAGIIQSL